MCVTCLSFFSKWRFWIRPVLVAIYVLIIIIVVPVLIVNSIDNGFSKSDQGALVGGAFVMLALPISFWQITQHIVHYTEPLLQKHIIRILWMVPIYAINAWVGLVFPDQSIYMDSLRECYEGYVIYNFMGYLLHFLGMHMDLEASLQGKPQVGHLFPLCCLTPWEMGREFVHMCKHGILQYTVVRPITTFISVICELCGVYGEGNFSFSVAFPYIVIVNNMSQFVAMYCLVLFYKANKEELRPMRPLGKFLCIKAVVFFSFFQGVIINILVYYGVIKSMFSPDGTESVQNVSSKLQDFLICIEMFLAAIAHHYSFSYKAYVDPMRDTGGCCGAFMAMWDVSDVHRDVFEHIGVVSSSLSRRLRGRSMYTLARDSEYDSLVQPGLIHVATSAPPLQGYQGYGSIPTEIGDADKAVVDTGQHDGNFDNSDKSNITDKSDLSPESFTDTLASPQTQFIHSDDDIVV